MSNPALAVFHGPAVVASNDDWGDDAALVAAFARVGAFPLSGGSRDAAVLLRLPPGPHTVQVRGAPGTTTGEVLVEVYLVE
jgi:hypothetical protein